MLRSLRRMKQKLQQQRQPHQLQLPQLHRQLHVLVTIHSRQVAQFRVHLVQGTIHSQQGAQFRVRHNDQRDREHLVQEWQEHVPVLFVQVLQRVPVHHDQQELELEQEITHHVQVEHQHHLVLTVHKVQQVEHQVLQADHNVQVAVLTVRQVAVEQRVHLERMRVNLQSVSRSHERRCAKSSTICRHNNLVAQLIRTVM